MRKVTFSHATLTYKVTLRVYSAVVYCFLDFRSLTQKHAKQNKIHRSSFSTSRYIPKYHVFNVLTFRGCQDDVIWRHMTSSIITLTIPDSVWHISRKRHQRILRYSYFPQDSDYKYASGGRKIPSWALWVLNNSSFQLVRQQSDKLISWYNKHDVCFFPILHM